MEHPLSWPRPAWNLELRWATKQHSGPDNLEHEMPSLMTGASKVVRGLSRLHSGSVSAVSSISFPSIPLSVRSPSKASSTVAVNSISILGSSPSSSVSSTDDLFAPEFTASPPPSYAALYSPATSFESACPLTEAALRTIPVDEVVAEPLVSRLFTPEAPTMSLPATNLCMAHHADFFEAQVVDNDAEGTRTMIVSVRPDTESESESVSSVKSMESAFSILSNLSSGSSYTSAATSVTSVMSSDLPSSPIDPLNLRETLFDLLDHAEQLGCTGLLIALEKDREDLGEILHALVYVGGVIITSGATVGKGKKAKPNPWQGARDNVVLVGVEI